MSVRAQAPAARKGREIGLQECEAAAMLARRVAAAARMVHRT